MLLQIPTSWACSPTSQYKHQPAVRARNKYFLPKVAVLSGPKLNKKSPLRLRPERTDAELTSNTQDRPSQTITRRWIDNQDWRAPRYPGFHRIPLPASSVRGLSQVPAFGPSAMIAETAALRPDGSFMGDHHNSTGFSPSPSRSQVSIIHHGPLGDQFTIHPNPLETGTTLLHPRSVATAGGPASYIAVRSSSPSPLLLP